MLLHQRIFKRLVVQFRATWTTYQSKPKKQKKSTPKKNSLYFRKWNFLTLILKELFFFFQKKLFLYFLKRNFFLYFRTWNPVIFTPSSKNNVNPPRGNLLYFRKQKPPKNSLYFVKIVFFVSTDFIPNSIIFF